eukprot:CAMPEP_0114499178 /NCGR_PEP_ID=MMETSP0109-20121206/7277_1 /TAXON_ID=29199 /ORGANISM="Chlorarachnion reptans, Strain CCCM449" /LENGTH=271 /DNA_ID=CAMNT_0001676725 /DNA_START=29 /DNA_END=844 /DNA_ORIENTATION=-
MEADDTLAKRTTEKAQGEPDESRELLSSKNKGQVQIPELLNSKDKESVQSSQGNDGEENKTTSPEDEDTKTPIVSTQSTYGSKDVKPKQNTNNVEGKDGEKSKATTSSEADDANKPIVSTQSTSTGGIKDGKLKQSTNNAEMIDKLKLLLIASVVLAFVVCAMYFLSAWVEQKIVANTNGINDADFVAQMKDGNLLAKAVCYMKGLGGLKTDFKKAVKLFYEALNEGQKDALQHLGDAYKNGWGVKQSIEMAEQFYRQAKFGRMKGEHVEL